MTMVPTACFRNTCAGTEILHGMSCPCPGEEAVAALLGATAA